MKIKKLWIPALLLGIIGGGAKICDTLFNVNGDGFFIDSTVCNGIFISVIVLILLIGMLMNFADRNTEITAKVSKDGICGIFGFIASVALIGSGVMMFLSMGSSSSFVLNFIMCILNLFGGAVLLYESCISFTGHNSMKNLPVLTLAMPFWCCGRFFGLFMDYSKVSIRATEMFDIISVALLMMFLFYQAMFFSEIGDTMAVKRGTLYGTLFIVCGLITTSDIIIKMLSPSDIVTGADVLIIEPTVSRILSIVADISLCGYAGFFIKDMHKTAVEVFEEEEKFPEKAQEKESEEDVQEEKPEINIEDSAEEEASVSDTKKEDISKIKPEITVSEEIHEETEPQIVLETESKSEIETENIMTITPIIIEAEEEMPAIEIPDSGIKIETPISDEPITDDVKPSVQAEHVKTEVKPSTQAEFVQPEAKTVQNQKPVRIPINPPKNKKSFKKAQKKTEPAKKTTENDFSAMFSSKDNEYDEILNIIDEMKDKNNNN